MVHLAWLGREGFRELGELLVQRTAYARERLAAVEGVELLHEAPVVREFAVRLDAPVDAVLDRCAERGIAAGYPLGREYPEYEDGLLVAITERRTPRADRRASPRRSARRSRRAWRSVRIARGSARGGRAVSLDRDRRCSANAR